MASLTKRQRNELGFVLRHLERAHTYIMRSDYAVCMKRKVATTTLDFTRADGAVLTEVERSYGSDLTGLKTGIEALKLFLTQD